jgi:hypothetical protein|tara:strand:- start:512 stop:1852 length:1341 start_codon:yes stop_codon:yes gene_type:complete
MRLSIRDNNFNADDGSLGSTIEAVIINAASVSRAYYQAEYNADKAQKPICWSTDTQQPASGVLSENKQSARCLDCQRNIRGSEGRACRFSQKIALVFEDKLCEVHQLQVPANSIFGKATNNEMPLQEYARFLQKRGTSVSSVYTKIYFDESSRVPKLFFAPKRPLGKEEEKQVADMVDHTDTIRAITTDYSEGFNTTSSEENEEMKYMIQNVTAQWPKLDRPYQYVEGKGHQPCSVDAEGAAYEVGINIPHAEAGKLRKAMKAWYDEKKAENDKKNPKNEWPEFEDGYEIVSEEGAAKEDRIYRKKCKLKAKYDTPTKKPLMLKANLQPCADDFELTTGSTINIEVTFYAWANKAMGCGVSLRPQAVQVIKLEPRMERETSFTPMEGYGSDESEAGSSFTAVTSEPVQAEASNDDFEEPEEPKKIVKKKGNPPEDKDLEDIVDDWD